MDANQIAIRAGLAALLVSVNVVAADKTNIFTGAYSVNGTASPILTLVRGKTYLFNASAISSLHPLKLTTSSTGGGGSNIFTNKVAGAQPCCSAGCSGTTFIFAPDDTSPDTIYYQCNIHANLGNQIRIVNPPLVSSIMATGGLIGITFTNAYATTADVQRATDLFTNDWLTVQVITSAPGVTTIALTNNPPPPFLRITTPLP